MREEMVQCEECGLFNWPENLIDCWNCGRELCEDCFGEEDICFNCFDMQEAGKRIQRSRNLTI